MNNNLSDETIDKLAAAIARHNVTAPWDYMRETMETWPPQVRVKFNVDTRDMTPEQRLQYFGFNKAEIEAKIKQEKEDKERNAAEVEAAIKRSREREKEQLEQNREVNKKLLEAWQQANNAAEKAYESMLANGQRVPKPQPLPKPQLAPETPEELYTSQHGSQLIQYDWGRTQDDSTTTTNHDAMLLQGINTA